MDYSDRPFVSYRFLLKFLSHQNASNFAIFWSVWAGQKRFGKLTQKRRSAFVTLLFLVNVPMQCLNGAIPSRKRSIKAPAKWRHSVYVLTEICHQRSKWLGPKETMVALTGTRMLFSSELPESLEDFQGTPILIQEVIIMKKPFMPSFLLLCL